MPRHPKTSSINSFSGLNNTLRPENTPQNFLKKAENVNIDKSGRVSKREGYTLIDAANYSSLWSSENGLGCYGIRNRELIRLYPDNSFVVLKNDIIFNNVSFDEIDGKVYFVSPEYSGIIQDNVISRLGVTKNVLSPSLSISEGSLSKGTYQVSFTYVNSEGIEGGTVPASTIDVPDNSAIEFTLPIFSDPDIIFARVYCSTPDGNTLYFSKIGMSGDTIKISDSSNLINPLRTFNIDPAPKGTIIKYHKSRLYIVDGNLLWYSEPFQYNYWKLNSNYLELPEEITDIFPVEDGVWVASDKLYYLSGGNPNSYSLSLKENIKVIKGTGSKISGSYLRIDNTPSGYKWLVSSDLGIFALFNQGLAINLTSQNVELKKAESGASLFIQDNGMNNYLSILKTSNSPNNSVVGDLVETSIIRNGIVI